MAEVIRFEGWFGRQPQAYQREYLGQKVFDAYQADKSTLPTYRQTVVAKPITLEELKAEDEKLLNI